jgi:hypothetical protein
VIGQGQQRELENLLDRHGWQVIHREHTELEWWQGEVWTLESQWSPRGFRLYLTFLVDPMSESRETWAVDASLDGPSSSPMGDDIALISRSDWRRGALPELVAALDRLRLANSSRGQ